MFPTLKQGFAQAATLAEGRDTGFHRFRHGRERSRRLQIPSSSCSVLCPAVICLTCETKSFVAVSGKKKRSRGRRGAGGIPDLLQELQQEAPGGVPPASVVGIVHKLLTPPQGSSGA